MQEPAITLYVLRSRQNGRRYLGIARDIARRMHEHRCKHSKGGQMLGDFDLVLCEDYPTYAAGKNSSKAAKDATGLMRLSPRSQSTRVMPRRRNH